MPQNTDLPFKKLPNPIEAAKTVPEHFEPNQSSEPNTLLDDKETITIKAPLVGTYYAAPKPDAPPFISLGETVREGQIICVIEAMKIFNEIESEISGKVIKLLIKDGSPIEYDQDLIVVTPE